MKVWSTLWCGRPGDARVGRDHLVELTHVGVDSDGAGLSAAVCWRAVAGIHHVGERALRVQAGVVWYLGLDRFRNHMERLSRAWCGEHPGRPPRQQTPRIIPTAPRRNRCSRISPQPHHRPNRVSQLFHLPCLPSADADALPILRGPPLAFRVELTPTRRGRRVVRPFQLHTQCSQTRRWAR